MQAALSAPSGGGGSGAATGTVPGNARCGVRAFDTRRGPAEASRPDKLLDMVCRLVVLLLLLLCCAAAAGAVVVVVVDPGLVLGLRALSLVDKSGQREDVGTLTWRVCQYVVHSAA